MYNNIQSIALEEKSEIQETEQNPNPEDGNEYSFDGYKIVINEKIELTPVVATKTFDKS